MNAAQHLSRQAPRIYQLFSDENGQPGQQRQIIVGGGGENYIVTQDGLLQAVDGQQVIMCEVRLGSVSF